ncbi:MAG: DEAD/DEAH box helicase family protein [Nitrosopumilus sp.]|uniref:helicase C-terminal domain-containing protein n=1 Tax=Nitrosopumilus sp. TaxID=2024843 RepID=UPI00246D7316|nr:helicase C-terminal domain-containing protein [Nitrosopumilus sp.]MDH5431102.1 DEAD/DEAH box helicase family protein [Nitrosopumilus sp.]
MLSLLEKFPDQFTPRDIQKEILSQIEEKLKSGFKKIILCAPTGVGKSLVGATVSNYFDSSFTVTASKHLQDQYIKDIPFLKPVKGKQNFPCLKLMASEKVDNERRAMRWGLTCDKGECQERVNKNGKEVFEVCKFKPTINQVEENTQDSPSCHYYMQKYDALVSKHSLWNYHAFFTIMKFNKKLFEEYLDRKITVFDEAHKIEDQIIQFVGFDIFSGQIDECNLNSEKYDFTDLDSMIQLTDDMAFSYAKKIKDIKESAAFQNNPDYELITGLERRHDRSTQAKIDIMSDKDNFIVNNPVKDLNGNFRIISVKPIDVSKFANSFFETEYQIFMSATIDKSSFCENMGLRQDDVAFVDTQKSPFPIENRSIELLNIRRLSYGSTEEDELEVIKTIDRIMDEHSDERGLILTSSIPRCQKIIRYLSHKNTQRIRICHSKNKDGKTQDEVISEHATDPTGVLLSSSLWEGVDLKDDLSRFQIIAKVPYPNYTEKRTRAKMDKFPLWYTSQTLTKILQGFGRSIRSEDDWAKTYVLDTAVNNVFFKGQQMIPKAYYDVLGMDNV